MTDPIKEPDDLVASLSLVRQAKRGDDHALNALFKRYYPRVLQIARLRLGSALRARLESEDIAQDAFTRAVKGFERFELRHEGAFLHWLGELVLNSVRDRHDHFHAQKRDVSAEVPLPQPRADLDTSQSRSLPGPDPTPSRVLQNKEDMLRLSAALDQLPADARDVIVFRDMEGLGFAEIGKLLDRSEDAARMHYARSKAKLVELFQAR